MTDPSARVDLVVLPKGTIFEADASGLLQDFTATLKRCGVSRP